MKQLQHFCVCTYLHCTYGQFAMVHPMITSYLRTPVETCFLGNFTSTYVRTLYVNHTTLAVAVV
jgi:hypothetical protein